MARRKLIDPVVIGSKGGKARAAALSPAELSEQGRKAVQERWRRYREAKRQEASKPDAKVRATPKKKPPAK
jgi:hypothetical protein